MNVTRFDRLMYIKDNEVNALSTSDFIFLLKFITSFMIKIQA